MLLPPIEQSSPIQPSKQLQFPGVVQTPSFMQLAGQWAAEMILLNYILTLSMNTCYVLWWYVIIATVV